MSSTNITCFHHIIGHFMCQISGTGVPDCVNVYSYVISLVWAKATSIKKLV